VVVADRGMDIKAGALKAFGMAGNILFPPVCAGCRNVVSEPGLLCGPCWRRLTLIERPWCEILGTPFTLDMGEGMVSPEAIANPPPFARARSAVAYTGVARRLVQGLKFQDRTELARSMAAWMARAGGELLAEADMIVPVPLHRRRFFSRRYNQAAELARALSDLSGVAVDNGLLVRARSTRQQVGLAVSERAGNVRGAFAVAPPARERLRGRRVLLVDDVYTTGATVSAAARILKRRGAMAVDVLTFARVLERDFPLAGGDPI
jgi:ComF family protein